MQLHRRGQRSAENITQTKGGPTAASRNVESPVDSWELFFTNEILRMIIDSTNRKIDTFRKEYNDELEENDKNIDLICLQLMIYFTTKVHWIYSVLQCNTSDIHSYGDFWILVIKK